MSGLIRMDRLSTTAGADARSAACSSSGTGYLCSDIPSATPASNDVEAKSGWRGMPHRTSSKKCWQHHIRGSGRQN
jgi:hypothetical protein